MPAFRIVASPNSDWLDFSYEAYIVHIRKRILKDKNGHQVTTRIVHS